MCACIALRQADPRPRSTPDPFQDWKQSRKDKQLSQLKKEDALTITCARIWGKCITTATTKAAVSPITTKTEHLMIAI
jgi:hypothetical protein